MCRCLTYLFPWCSGTKKIGIALILINTELSHEFSRRLSHEFSRRLAKAPSSTCTLNVCVLRHHKVRTHNKLINSISLPFFSCMRDAPPPLSCNWQSCAGLILSGFCRTMPLCASVGANTINSKDNDQNHDLNSLKKPKGVEKSKQTAAKKRSMRRL